MCFPTVGGAGRRGKAAVQDEFEVPLFWAGGVGAAVLRLIVGTGAKGANSRILASLFDMAKLPAVAILCERGGRVGAFDNTIFALEPGELGVIHPPTVLSGNLHHHRAGTLAVHTERAVGVEVAGWFNNGAFGVFEGGGEGGGEMGIVIWHGIEGKAVNGELEVGGGKGESLPGAIGDGQGLIEAGGKGLKKGDIRRDGDGSGSNGESDGTFAIGKELNGNRELGVSLFEDRGTNVSEADMDEGFFRVKGMRSAGGVEPSGSA